MDTTKLIVDNEAKPHIYLKKILDANDNPYYIGKYQIPGTLDFEEGVSFMVFTSEDGSEELQIGPIDPEKHSRAKRSSAGFKDGRLVVDLHPFLDSNGDIAYVGEAKGLGELPTLHGIFFTIFLSREGSEELQISRLNHNQIRRRGYENEYEYDNEQAPPRQRIDSVTPEEGNV